MDDVEMVRVLKALADPRRLRMVQEIASAGELSCGQLGERFPLSQPAISHHLKILSQAGLLTVRNEAQHHFVSVNHALIAALSRLLPSRVKPARASAKRARPVRKAAGRP